MSEHMSVHMSIHMSSHRAGHMSDYVSYHVPEKENWAWALPTNPTVQMTQELQIGTAYDAHVSICAHIVEWMAGHEMSCGGVVAGRNNNNNSSSSSSSNNNNIDYDNDNDGNDDNDDILYRSPRPADCAMHVGRNGMTDGSSSKMPSQRAVEEEPDSPLLTEVSSDELDECAPERRLRQQQPESPLLVHDRSNMSTFIRAEVGGSVGQVPMTLPALYA